MQSVCEHLMNLMPLLNQIFDKLIDETKVVVDTLLPEIIEGEGLMLGLELRNNAKVQELGVLISNRPILQPFSTGINPLPVSCLETVDSMLRDTHYPV